MADDIRRPGVEGGLPIPAGMRARNKTLVMGADKMTSMRAQIEGSAPLQEREHERAGAGVKAAVSQSLQRDDGFVSPLSWDSDPLESLEDIFGHSGGHHGADVEQSNDAKQATPMHEEVPASDPLSAVSQEGVAAQDSHSTFDDFGMDELPEQAPPATISVSRIVRPAHIEAAKIIEPVEQDPLPEGFSRNIDNGVGFDALFDDVATLEPVEAAPQQAFIAPRIVRAGDVQVAVAVPQSQHLVTEEIAEDPESSYQMEYVQSPTIGGQAMAASLDEIFWKVNSQLVGFLVTYDHDPKGTYVELHAGRLIISCQREESGSCLVVPDPSVSPMHAIMRVAPGGRVQVLDQLSESGTRVKHVGHSEEEFLSGEKSTLSHGDVVFFGERKFHVLLVVEDEGALA